MDVKEKLLDIVKRAAYNCLPSNTKDFHLDMFVTDLLANGVTVQEWISVKERTPTDADGTVLVCLADVFPYNDKEPYPDAKHDGRITEAHYSEFSKRWYRGGGIFPNGVVTHWMEKPQPPKGE